MSSRPAAAAAHLYVIKTKVLFYHLEHRKRRPCVRKITCKLKLKKCLYIIFLIFNKEILQINNVIFIQYLGLFIMPTLIAIMFIKIFFFLSFNKIYRFVESYLEY